MDIKWFIDYRNMTFVMTKLDSIAEEDGFSIGEFASKASRSSCNDVPEVFNFENNLNSNFHASYLSNIDLVQVETDDKLDHDYLPNSTFDTINNTTDNTNATDGP